MHPVQTRAPVPGGVRWEYRGDYGVVSFTLSDDNHAVLSIHTTHPNDYNDNHSVDGCRSMPGQRVYCASMPEAAKTLYRRWLEDDEDERHDVIFDALRAEYAAHVIAVTR